jgi:beta-glucanase (GH16 family)
MKKVLFLLVVSMMMASCRNQPQWQLVWEENFNGVELDTTVWSMIPRGKPDWQNTMSMDERCYELRDGQLILRGIINEDLQKDSSPYLTGGVWTKNKKSFVRGRVEIRAKLEGAQGAWPAIWMLPYEIEKYAWPEGGEVDIMERLNYDTFVYQTVHSHYTYHLKEDKNPPNGTTASIHPNDFNVYGVDFWPDSLVFHVNGVKTYT